MTSPAPELSPYPWLPLEDVLAELRIDAGSDQADNVESWRRAACAWVLGQLGAPAAYVPDDAQRAGTLLLVSRLWARRGPPTGIASFAEFGPATILRVDPDVERLLGLGRNAAPAIG